MAYQSEIEKLEQRFSEKPEQWFAAVADAYRKAGELDKALEILNTWIEKRPKYTSGHIVLGRCLVDKGSDQEAAPVFEGVLGLDPENIIALKTLGEIAERAGNRDGALGWVERLLEVDPMNEEALETRERLTAPPEVEEEPVVEAAAEAPAEAAATPEVSGELAIESAPEVAMEAAAEPPPEPAVELEPLEFAKPEAAPEAPPMPEPVEAPEPLELAAPAAEPEPMEFEGVVEATGGLELERAPEAMPDGALEMADVGVEPTSLDEAPAAEGALPEFEVSLEAEPPAAVEAPVEGFETPTPPEVPPTEVATELAAEPAVEGLEPLAPVDEAAEEVGVVADDLGLEPFDEGLAWDAGERTSRAISQDDIQEAKAAHEEALDVPAHAIPGLEGESVPEVGMEERGTPPAEGLVGVDTVPTPAAPAEPEGETGDVLQLIMPEDASGADEVPTTAAEPEPVVTETMAELYVKQGLLAEAREIYLQLLAARPGDPRLEGRLAALDARAAAPPAPPPPPPGGRYSVAVTGGASARAFFTGLAAAKPGDPLPDPAPPPAPPPVEDAAPPPAEPPAPAPEPAAQAPTGDAQGSGFSFDEFFGGEGQAKEPTPSAEAPAPKDGEEDDDFRSWLQGLKT